jgi:hypothetical protein
MKSMFFRTQIWERPFKFGDGLFTELGKVSETFRELPQSQNHPSYGVLLSASYLTDDFIGRTIIVFSSKGYQLIIGADDAVELFFLFLTI